MWCHTSGTDGKESNPPQAVLETASPPWNMRPCMWHFRSSRAALQFCAHSGRRLVDLPYWYSPRLMRRVAAYVPRRRENGGGALRLDFHTPYGEAPCTLASPAQFSAEFAPFCPAGLAGAPWPLEQFYCARSLPALPGLWGALKGGNVNAVPRTTAHAAAGRTRTGDP